MKDAGGALEFPNFTFLSTKKEAENKIDAPALILSSSMRERQFLMAADP
jgi:hypothetical protein